MKILVTGSSGFIGQEICTQLEKINNFEVIGVTRKNLANTKSRIKYINLGDQTSNTDWSSSLHGVTAVIHSAARVHVMNEKSTDPLSEFRKHNVASTLNLARQAAEFGVSRFIFISSIKVNGEATSPGFVFTADDTPAPSDPYGISKLEAEQGLMHLSSVTGMEIVIIRPVLVYGPGVKANFLSMMNWLNKGIPLPLGCINNKRSLVSLNNLVDLVITCIYHPAAANQIFLVSDGEDLSTSDLLRRMGKALVKPARLLPVPAIWLELAATLIGKRSMAQRLCGSLQVDIGKTRQLLGWSPPLSVDQGLKLAAKGLNK